MAIQPHNEKAAATWGSGGADYDKISECIADSIEHLLNRLDVQPGERALDLATGTGWTARRLAQKGAKVTGVDIGEGVVEAAKRLARQANLDIDFAVGDAEGTDLPSGAFDVIASTCGVMFASRPGGGGEGVGAALPSRRAHRPDDLAADQHARPDVPDDAPLHAAAAEPRSPVALRVGQARARFRACWAGTSTCASRPARRCCACPRASTCGRCSARATGPPRCCNQNTDRKDELRRDFIAFHDAHRTEVGVAMPRDYLVVVGTRR